MRYLLDFIFRVIRLMVAAWLFVFLAPIIIYSAFQLANYNLYSHNFAPSQSCGIGEKLLGDIKRQFVYNCIDVSQNKEISDYENFILFMASEHDSGPNITGHGWLAYASIKRQADGGLLLVEYQVRGFWGDPQKVTCPAWITNAYGTVRSFLPYTDVIEHNYQVFCRGGIIGAEAAVSIENPAGVPLPNITSSEQLYNLLARKPEVLLAVRVNNNQYNNAKYNIYEGVNHNYSLILDDCTTYVSRVAKDLHLYIPPRILRPFPSDFIIELSEDNIRQ